MNISLIIGIIVAIALLGIIICLMALLILDSKIKSNDKKLRQVSDIQWYFDHGTPIEEILKMPMPKKLKRDLLKIYSKNKDIEGE